MERILGQSADHCKESELFLVEESKKGERTTKKEDNRFWCLLVEFLKSFKRLLVVLSECLQLRLKEIEGTKAREQDRESVQLFNSE